MLAQILRGSLQDKQRNGKATRVHADLVFHATQCHTFGKYFLESQ